MPESSIFALGRKAEFSDAVATMSSMELMAQAHSIAARLRDEGLENARLCLPLESGLGSLATLIAVMEHGIGAALLARPAEGNTPAVPAFADAIVMPPPTGAAPTADGLVITPVEI